MADQGKWFKLWCTSLHDESLENLSLEDWARWARLGAYIKQHGKDGMIRFNPPYRALLNLFRMSKIEDAIVVLHEFPNCMLGERSFTVSTGTPSPVSLEVTYTNWLRYQGDFSSDRVRAFRDKKRHHETLQEEKRSRREVEEKRVDNTPLPPELDFASLWDTYPKRLGKKNALRHFKASVKTPEDYANIKLALANYKRQTAGKELEYIKNGDTWFNNWQDYVNYPGDKHAPNGRTSLYSPIAVARAKSEAEKVRENAPNGAIPARVGDLPDV